MSTLAIDAYRLLIVLKGTGKGANFSAEEIANAIRGMAPICAPGANSGNGWSAPKRNRTRSSTGSKPIDAV